MSHYYKDSIFWIDVHKIKPNPFQPRKEFNQAELESLADSIKQYGVLQALVVTRKEVEKPDGGLDVEYELIAGERRLRASKLAGLQQVPVLIKIGDETDQMKLELAIIENIQREDLNPLDRARAFDRLAREFRFKHIEIAKKVGKSREYVSNTLRILTMPQEIQDALGQGKISEGHTRPILMLGDRPDEQMVLFKEIMLRRLTVREAEAISRKIAYDKVRKQEYKTDPETAELEEKMGSALGTRVSIERKANGGSGKVVIDFFSDDDLHTILELVKSNKNSGYRIMVDQKATTQLETPESEITSEEPQIIDDRAPAEKDREENELYSVKNFSL